MTRLNAHYVPSHSSFNSSCTTGSSCSDQLPVLNSDSDATSSYPSPPPDFMTLDHFYGGSGIDVLCPNQAMSSNQFSESEWNFPHLVPLNPNDYETPYNPQRIPPPIEVSPLPGHVMSYPRPKSSPSTFGPNVEDLLFSENPFRIKHEDFPPPMFSMSPMPSTKAPSPYFGGDYAASNPNASPGKPGPVPIAPDPVGLRQMNALKRLRDEEEYLEIGQKRRKRAPSQVGPVELNEEEQLLLKLKEEENLPWKDIAVRFQTDLGKSYQVPALQMRFKRLRERMRTWTETDVQALEQAYDYWEKFQFDIIAAKMLDFGASERWPAKYCARKWEEIHPGRIPFQTGSHQLLQDPWGTEQCSPVDSLTHSPRPL